MAEHYVYRARTPDNQIVTGRIQAVNIDAARKVLTEHRLVPISVTVPRGFADVIPFLNKVSLKERTLFSRQLSTMIEAGLTLTQSLRLLIRQSKKGYFQTVMSGVLADLQDGFSFSTSLAKYPDVFDQVFVNVIQSGEATGKLEVVLKELAHNQEKEVSLRSKIRGALFYPIFVLLTMVVVAYIMTTKVIPQLKDVFLSSGQELPGSTQFLILLSDFVIGKWYVLLLCFIALVIGIRYYLRTPGGQVAYGKYSLKAPIAGNIIELSSMARFARLLGMLLGSGVPLLEALRLITDSFSNRTYQDALGKVAHEVERGIPMSSPISANSVFPAMVGQMVAVGEQTGKMDEVMIKLAEYFEAEVDDKVGGLASLIEPVVIVILGLGVAWLVQAILLPIYQISTTV